LDDFVGGALGGIPTVTVNSASRCSNGAAVTLTATPGSGSASDYTYSWTGPNSFTATTQSISVSDAGQYCVTITKIQGQCPSEAACGTVSVTTAPAPTAQPLTVCENGSTGQGTFNLNSAITNNGGGTVSFYTSLAKAQA
jgi:hypothetical protein